MTRYKRGVMENRNENTDNNDLLVKRYIKAIENFTSALKDIPAPYLPGMLEVFLIMDHQSTTKDTKYSENDIKQAKGEIQKKLGGKINTESKEYIQCMKAFTYIKELNEAIDDLTIDKYLDMTTKDTTEHQQSRSVLVKNKKDEYQTKMKEYLIYYENNAKTISQNEPESKQNELEFKQDKPKPKLPEVESGDLFDRIIVRYLKSDTDSLEKIDIFKLQQLLDITGKPPFKENPLKALLQSSKLEYTIQQAISIIQIIKNIPNKKSFQNKVNNLTIPEAEEIYKSTQNSAKNSIEQKSQSFVEQEQVAKLYTDLEYHTERRETIPQLYAQMSGIHSSSTAFRTSNVYTQLYLNIYDNLNEATTKEQVCAELEKIATNAAFEKPLVVCSTLTATAIRYINEIYKDLLQTDPNDPYREKMLLGLNAFKRVVKPELKQQLFTPWMQFKWSVQANKWKILGGIITGGALAALSAITCGAAIPIAVGVGVAGGAAGGTAAGTAPGFFTRHKKKILAGVFLATAILATAAAAFFGFGFGGVAVGGFFATIGSSLGIGSILGINTLGLGATALAASVLVVTPSVVRAGEMIAGKMMQQTSTRKWSPLVEATPEFEEKTTPTESATMTTAKLISEGIGERTAVKKANESTLKHRQEHKTHEEKSAKPPETLSPRVK